MTLQVSMYNFASVSRVLLPSAGLLVCWFLYTAYTNRIRVRRLKWQGIPIATHSIIFGHLTILKDFVREHPPDVSIYVFHDWLASNYRRYFEKDVDQIPPVVYLDLWPMGPPFALVYDTDAVAQFTRSKNLLKFSTTRQYIEPLTSNQDIITTEGQEWRLWRTRFNSGFSTKHITALIPHLIEEMLVFVDILREASGKEGGWGPVFPLLDRTTNLTLDIICRATLGMRLHEQTNIISTPLKAALFDQIRLMSKSGVQRWSPWYWPAVARNNSVLHSVIEPQLRSALLFGHAHTTTPTIINLAMDSARDAEALKPVHSPYGRSSNEIDPKSMQLLLSNVKAFLFAGHDTTASTICFIMKCLQDNPDCLAHLRAEHDAVLGTDPNEASTVLAQSPHLLNNLPYTTAVIKETLRLHPIASTIREGSPDTCLTVRGSYLRFPTHGFCAWVAISSIQKSPKYWPRPEEFLPTRWIVDPTDPLHPLKDAWIPFSLGPRNYIGMQLAMIELTLVCVFLARAFDLREAWDKWDEKYEHRGAKTTDSVGGQRLYASGVGPIRPKDGMPVQVRVRASSVAT